ERPVAEGDRSAQHEEDGGGEGDADQERGPQLDQHVAHGSTDEDGGDADDELLTTGEGGPEPDDAEDRERRAEGGVHEIGRARAEPAGQRRAHRVPTTARTRPRSSRWPTSSTDTLAMRRRVASAPTRQRMARTV